MRVGKKVGFNKFIACLTLLMGMAPLSSFTEKEESSATERAVAFFLRRLEFLFSFGGIRHFKAKYADRWEPRYVIYKRAMELPRLGIALTKIAELKPQGARLALIRSALATEPATPETGRPTSQPTIGFTHPGPTAQAYVPGGGVNRPVIRSVNRPVNLEDWRRA